jgi:hypothetical protein
MPAHNQINALVLGAASLLGLASPAFVQASELSYTFLDFQALDSTLETTGSQRPVPQQLVGVTTRGGDGIAVAGSLALPRRFYAAGAFRTSIIDIGGVVESPLTRVTVSDTFDLVSSTLGVGYQRELAENFDLIAELSYDSVDYDFGSFAGENFDVSDSGMGGRVGFRWNPAPAFELFAAARHSPVGKVNLSTRQLGSDTSVSTGVRWYFFNDLGVGVDYETGEIETFTFSLRFGFGNLPW